MRLHGIVASAHKKYSQGRHSMTQCQEAEIKALLGEVQSVLHNGSSHLQLTVQLHGQVDKDLLDVLKEDRDDPQTSTCLAYLLR